jgi:hypothetical protein
MDYQIENDLLLGQVALPNLYDYFQAVPADVKISIFCNQCCLNCLLYVKIIKPEIKLEETYEDSF